MIEVDVKKFRKKFLDAYQNCNDEKLPPLSQIGQSVENPYIKAILAHMYEVLSKTKEFKSPKYLTKNDEVIGTGTLFKVLYSENDLENFSPKIHKRIETYIRLANTEETPLGSRKFIFTAASLIDEKFRDEKLKLKKSINAIDFYTSKLNNGLQWIGVAGDFYVQRSIDVKLKIITTQAFQTKNSKIAALILGLSGSGKTATLRHLALSCVSNTNFKILWVNYLSDFNVELKQIGNNGENYLIVIDDWAAIERNNKGKADFLDYLANFDNVRVIIGDYFERTDYTDFLHKARIFTLCSDDNKYILEKVIEKTPEFQNIDKTALFKSSTFVKAPLFMLLFVLGRTYSIESGEEKLDVNDFVSQFKKIVKNDLQAIFEAYEGLAISLYYYAWMYKNNRRILSWKTFLEMADMYNRNDRISDVLSDYDENNPVIKILSHYFSLEPHSQHEFNPDLFGILCKFHHDSLPEEGLIQPLLRHWYYNDSIGDKIAFHFTDPETTIVRGFYCLGLRE